jgi:hypothetical protein
MKRLTLGGDLMEIKSNRLIRILMTRGTENTHRTEEYTTWKKHNSEISSVR